MGTKESAKALMHENAKAWDKIYDPEEGLAKKYKKKHWFLDEKTGKHVPLNRPCEEMSCGRPVEKGWMHKECSKKAWDFLSDIGIL